MKKSTLPKKSYRQNHHVVKPRPNGNLRQKNLVVALLVLALAGLFFFITLIRLKTGADLLGLI
ncbi:MAG: hypothetical protein ACR2NY_00570 [Alphaproteobacteria bacterium]